MTRITKNSLLALACTLFLTACGSSGPEDVTKTFVDALRSGDMKTIEKYSTPTTFSLVGMSIAMSCGNIENTSCIKNLSKNETIKEFKLISETESQALVNVKIEKNGKLKNSRYNLIKTEDGWKIDLRK